MCGNKFQMVLILSIQLIFCRCEMFKTIKSILNMNFIVSTPNNIQGCIYQGSIYFDFLQTHNVHCSTQIHDLIDCVFSMRVTQVEHSMKKIS